MQTFLPYPDFRASARVLDSPRLGKQRVEAMQLLNSLFVAGHGYRHHPASKMWRGYESALIAYAAVMCAEWTALGFGDTCLPQIASRGLVREQAELARRRELPAWLGDPDFHRAQQSNLIRKDPTRYGPLFPGVPPDLPYIWPPGRGGGE